VPKKLQRPLDGVGSAPKNPPRSPERHPPGGRSKRFGRGGSGNPASPWGASRGPPGRRSRPGARACGGAGAPRLRGTSTRCRGSAHPEHDKSPTRRITLEETTRIRRLQSIPRGQPPPSWMRRPYPPKRYCLLPLPPSHRALRHVRRRRRLHHPSCPGGDNGTLPSPYRWPRQPPRGPHLWKGLAFRPQDRAPPFWPTGSAVPLPLVPRLSHTPRSHGFFALAERCLVQPTSDWATSPTFRVNGDEPGNTSAATSFGRRPSQPSATGPTAIPSSMRTPSSAARGQEAAASPCRYVEEEDKRSHRFKTRESRCVHCRHAVRLAARWNTRPGPRPYRARPTIPAG
jgi:hypothetical protein